MSLEPNTHGFKAVALFSRELPRVSKFLRLKKIEPDVPIIGDTWMITSRSATRFKISQLRQMNPGITFLRLHGYRPSMPQALRQLVPTEGKHCATPIYPHTSTRWSHIADAMITKDGIHKVFHHKGKNYKLVMYDGLPYRWHYEELIDKTGKSTVPTYITIRSCFPYPLYLTWLREIYAESSYAKSFHAYLTDQ